MPEADSNSLCLPLEFTLPPHSPALRLDAALAAYLPRLGLRARRRLWAWCRVLVNKRERAPGFFVNAGDVVRLEARSGHSAPSAIVSGIALVALFEQYAVFYKPAGLHSAHIAASPEPSLEALLPDLWFGLYAQWLRDTTMRHTIAAPSSLLTATPPSYLLSRLDKETSGLVLAAWSQQATARFRQDEARGLVRKHYVAVLAGRLSEPLCVTARLQTANTPKTLVLEEENPDPTRHTKAEALGYARLEGGRVIADSKGPCTLARVTIQRGARHQIRAHCAAGGFPLARDVLYAGGGFAESGEESVGGGAECGTGGQGFFLHHALVELPCGCVRCMPPWLVGWGGDAVLSTGG